MHNTIATVDEKPKALRARMRMMNSGPLFALAIAGTLSACGPAIEGVESGATVEGTETIEETETGEETETIQQAVDVPRLEVGYVYWSGYVTAISFGGQTAWLPDRVHTVEIQIRLHKRHPGGTWGAVSPFYAKRAGNSLVAQEATVGCVSGLYKVEAKGRVLFSGGWSPFEIRVSSPFSVYCE
jgi:hypothetical protein